MDITSASFFSLLQCPINSITLIKTSCKYLELVNPFCALLVIRSVVVISLLFSAREIILYKLLRSEIGRQFFMSPSSPFFGIRRMLAVLKVSLKQPFAKQQLAYLSNGFRRTDQNCEINLPLSPSIQAADFLLAFLVASSSSNRVSGRSSFAFSDSVSLLSLIIGWVRIVGPRK